MGRKLRYIPDGGALVEVTCRTLHGRLLLRPSPELNDIAAGILGRAQRLYPVELILYSLSSNHYHLILWTKDAKRLSEFTGYFNSNLAREVSRLTGWTGKIWERRYQAIPISDEEQAQVARLKYVLSHGVKRAYGLRSGSIWSRSSPAATARTFRAISTSGPLKASVGSRSTAMGGRSPLLCPRSVTHAVGAGVQCKGQREAWT